ncbi:unnamed protein product [Sphacelaria rigidula]
MEYQNRFSHTKTDLGHCKTLPFEFTLQPGVSPISSRPYRTNPLPTQTANAILDAYLGAGLIHYSSSPWVPFLRGIKHPPYRSMTLTVHYQRLNRVTVVGKLPIPRSDEGSDSLGEGKIFNTFHLASGFFQIIIHPDAVPLKTFCTPSGLYEWLRMPQGAATAPGCLHRLMQRVTDGLEHLIMYLDDAIAFDASLKALLRTLRKLLSRLRACNGVAALS